MNKIFSILLAILASISIKTGVAISEHEFITNDGNIWAVEDNLEINKEYTVIFNTLNTTNIYDDEVLKIY